MCETMIRIMDCPSIHICQAMLAAPDPDFASRRASGHDADCDHT